MSESITCPKCGTSLRKGSTFCLKCGTRIDSTAVVSPESSSEFELPASTLDEIDDSINEEEALPELDEWEKWAEEDPLNLEPETTSTIEEDKPEDEIALPPIEEDLSWEEGISEPDAGLIEEDEEDSEPAKAEEIEPEPTASDMTWDMPKTSSDVKEGMPFKEVAPPKVVDAVTPPIVTEKPMKHMIKEVDPVTEEAVSHLFPSGRGDTTEDFIDSVVGKPKRIGADISPSMIETPTCPECGASMTEDSFEYPEYVYEAMGKARLDKGLDLLKDNAHEAAIEQFEMAKKLYEHASNSKMVEEATKRVDQGYDAMAEHHYVQGEMHLRESQFEWAIVQFRKARELYMFSTDSKKRIRCSERVRISYEEWGKHLEDEGDRLAKSGDTRSALAVYSEAAEKYRESDASKRLRGLEKKIRTA